MAGQFTRRYAVVHKTKTPKGVQGIKTDIGSVIEGPYGLSLALRAGTTIKITRGWDKEARMEVQLPEPIYLTGEDGYINLNPPFDPQSQPSPQPEHPAVTNARSAFNSTPVSGPRRMVSAPIDDPNSTPIGYNAQVDWDRDPAF